MSLEAFNHSEPLTLGVELELQLVNTNDYDLAPYAEDMLRLMKKNPLPGSVVPEMTNSMIEISTGICHSASEVLGQLTPIRDALVKDGAICLLFSFWNPEFAGPAEAEDNSLHLYFFPAEKEAKPARRRRCPRRAPGVCRETPPAAGRAAERRT